MLLCLEESMHNTNLKGNTVQEFVTQRSHIVIPELATSRRDAAPRYLSHRRSQRHQTPSPSPKGGKGIHSPLRNKLRSLQLKNEKKYSFFSYHR